MPCTTWRHVLRASKAKANADQRTRPSSHAAPEYRSVLAFRLQPFTHVETSKAGSWLAGTHDEVLGLHKRVGRLRGVWGGGAASAVGCRSGQVLRQSAPGTRPEARRSLAPAAQAAAYPAVARARQPRHAPGPAPPGALSRYGSWRDAASAKDRVSQRAGAGVVPVHVVSLASWHQSARQLVCGVHACGACDWGRRVVKAHARDCWQLYRPGSGAPETLAVRSRPPQYSCAAQANGPAARRALKAASARSPVHWIKELPAPQRWPYHTRWESSVRQPCHASRCAGDVTRPSMLASAQAVVS